MMTTDRDGNRSNPYKPSPEKCCEACVFGSGQHQPWCKFSGPALKCTVPGCDFRMVDFYAGHCAAHSHAESWRNQPANDWDAYRVLVYDPI